MRARGAPAAPGAIPPSRARSSSARCSPHGDPPPDGYAAARPTCFGHRATIVGNQHGQPHQGHPSRRRDRRLGGRDQVIGNGGRDIICGGGGQDRLFGGNAEPAAPRQAEQADRRARQRPTSTVASPATSSSATTPASRATPPAPSAATTSTATSATTTSSATTTPSFDATGGKHDAILGQKGNDTMIGDSAVTGDGTARGGGNDHFESMSDATSRSATATPPAGRRSAAARTSSMPVRNAISWSATATRGPGPRSAPAAIKSISGRGRTGLWRQLRGHPQGKVQGGQARLHRRRRRHRPPVRRARPRHLQRGPRARDSARQCEFVLEVP